MTSEFGTDLSSLEDLDETREVSGVELVAQDAFWRIQTPPSSGILQADAPDYGIDLLDLIGSAQTASDAAALPDRIRSELTKDERILTVDSKVTRVVEGPSESWDIRISCETAEGPFELVGTANSGELNLAVKLLPGAV